MPANTDGDIIHISFYPGKSIGVRFKGIDAPEMHRKYRTQEAAAYTAGILSPGTCRKLVSRGEFIDSIGRLLAYVYYKKGDEWKLNQREMLENGMMYVYWKYEFEYPEAFMEYQAVAMRNGIGMWAHPELIRYDVVHDLKEFNQKATWLRNRRTQH